MRPTLEFSKQRMLVGKRGEETTVPDLLGSLILQNQLLPHLDEEDEIYEGYGKRFNSYPYRQIANYSRELEEQEVQTAVLENAYLKAVFLPEYGGRLWSLWDKENDRNLLYTNDVLRFSNLAVRNAWFSGGVEWNISVIGHTPFTAEPMFTAQLENEKGEPILRMYEYERIRQATYQMDFWLGEEDRFLNARMRIVNESSETIPMYWWSNIAVPEHEKGRIVVPAKQAYTNRDGGIYKVDIPQVEGVDISRYRSIPKSVDYFFDIPKEQPKYIAHIDENGYGLLHMSTDRLQTRKLFSWGSKRAGDHWQEFLTEHAGRYIEIQGGLAKTQYGCIPMAPRAAWEWMERYGAIQLTEEEQQESFEGLRDMVTKRLLQDDAYQSMEATLKETGILAHKEGMLLRKGSPYGALKNAERQLEKKPLMEPHLDFGSCVPELEVWCDFIKTGVLAEPDAQEAPYGFMCDPVYEACLKQTISKENKDNWYAQYQLGLYYFQRGSYRMAARAFTASFQIRENAWAYHGLASAYVADNHFDEGADAILKGMQMRSDDITYFKEGLRILDICGHYEEILSLYMSLNESWKADGRICFYYINGLHKTGDTKKAFSLLNANGGLAVDDLREGELSLGDLWQEMHKALYQKEGDLPYLLDFTAF